MFFIAKNFKAPLNFSPVLPRFDRGLRDRTPLMGFQLDNSGLEYRCRLWGY